jgi:hypothetical protein
VPSPLTRNILNTIIYYDILDFPLTSFEVWKYLIGEESYTLGEVFEALDSDELKKQIEEFQGFYFLRGRKDLVDRRIQNDKNSTVKFEIAEKVAWWLGFVPFVRMIAVTGTLAMKNCEKNSDIDFFVVLERNKIFTGRLLATLAVHLLGKRRYGRKIKNRICLNYFITTERLEIARQDLFAANEYSFIYPILDSAVISSGAERSREIYEDKAVASHQVLDEDPSTRLRSLGMTKNNVFNQFCEANFSWIKKFKPNWEIPDLAPARYYTKQSKISRFIQKTPENLINFLGGDRIETWLKKKQIARIEQNPLTYKEGSYVDCSDQNLIFLPDPQGVRIEKEWQRRIEKL